MNYLFTPDDLRKVPIEELFGTTATWMVMLSAIVAIIGYVLLGALLLKRLWDSFFVSVLSLRPVTYDEATAMILIIIILASS